MRDFLIKCGYPAERAEMLLGDMKPYHRPEWWVLRRPTDLYYLSDRVQKLKTDGIIKGIDEIYFVDIHYLRTKKTWRGNSESDLLLIPYKHYVDPLDYGAFSDWREEAEDYLEEVENEPPYDPEYQSFDVTMPLLKFIALDKDSRKQRFHWTDNNYNLDEMVWETFESTWEHESGNPTYC